jgi:dTDP-4-amino-4,6-dideoxygalactose transaminase
MQALQDQQIGCAVYYPIALHQQDVFADDCTGLSLPVTEALTQDCFSLPIFPEMTDEQIVTVTDIIKQSA